MRQKTTFNRKFPAEADFEENLEEFSNIEEEEEDVDLDFDEESRDKLDETEDEEYIEEEKQTLRKCFRKTAKNLCKDFKSSEEKNIAAKYADYPKIIKI